MGPRNAPDPSGTEIAIGAVSVAYPGEEICGDAWRCEASGGRCVLIVADGLGHGIYAAEASRAALKINVGLRDFNAAEFVNEAHLRLKPTRGAAVAVADIDFPGRTVTFSGVGNVAGMVISGGGLRRQMISNNGTLGHRCQDPRRNIVITLMPMRSSCFIPMASALIGLWINIQDYRAVIRP